MDTCKENIVGRVGEREDEEMRKRERILEDGEENQNKKEEEEGELEGESAIVKEEKAYYSGKVCRA